MAVMMIMLLLLGEGGLDGGMSIKTLVVGMMI
jgi:hypothetical protein